MARQSRSTKVELNFDGLTDAVTNLTGTLILLVVLMLGITRAVTKEGSGGYRGGKPVDPLLQQVTALEMQINAIDEEISRLQRDLPVWQRRARELLDKSGAAPEPTIEEDEDTKPREARGRENRVAVLAQDPW